VNALEKKNENWQKQVRRKKSGKKQQNDPGGGVRGKGSKKTQIKLLTLPNGKKKSSTSKVRRGMRTLGGTYNPKREAQ